MLSGPVLTSLLELNALDYLIGMCCAHLNGQMTHNYCDAQQ